MRREIVSGLLALSCAAQGAVMAFELTSGLVDHQVVQCDENGLAALALSGTADTDGTVAARVVGVQKVVIDWRDLGETGTFLWSGTVPDVPAGGPYRVEVRLTGPDGATVTALVHDVLVGDVWVLAGQSNMQGVGDRYDEEEPHPMVHTFSMSYAWRLAEEPLHTLAESPDPVHFDPAQGETERENQVRAWRDGAKGAGLGLPFAREMVRRTGRPVGLIAAAHGGTSMAQWDPALKGEGGRSLYGSMVRQVAATGGGVCGVLWYQGESDAFEEPVQVFGEKLRELIAAMRRDFNNPELPFYQVQIGRVMLPWPEAAWNRIQTEQLAVEAEVPKCRLVTAIDLDLDDGIHIGTPGLKTLGMRLAKLAEADRFDGAVLPGPRAESAERVPSPYGARIRVTFSGVNGALTSAGRMSGFSIAQGPDGPWVPCVHKAIPDPADPHAVLVCVGELPEDPHLWYGRGLDPYCNVVDEAGMALPVFGPMRVR